MSGPGGRDGDGSDGDGKGLGKSGGKGDESCGGRPSGTLGEGGGCDAAGGGVG